MVTISVTSDSEEEAQEGKQAMRVGVRLPLPLKEKKTYYDLGSEKVGS